MTQPPEIFQKIYEQHGHRCPMSTLGGRMGLAALKALGIESNSELTAVFAQDTCAVDGIELTTGCSRSTGSLLVEESGRPMLVVRADEGQSVQVGLSERALATAWEYRTLDEAFNAGKGTLPVAELTSLHEQKEAVLQTVLEKFWTLSDEALLTVEMI